jgi:hypothetical protein
VTFDSNCKRHGCNRRRTGRNLERDCCSTGCAITYRWNQEAHALLAYLGHSDPVDEYLLATLDLGKALDRSAKARSELRRMSLDAGWTNEEWDCLIRGEYAAPGLVSADPQG